jgi:[ribosomal protein S18]-alanine N-acetyltransferase
MNKLKFEIGSVYMEYKIDRMNYARAKQISEWVYLEPYSIYNMDGSDGCINELLDGLYYTVTDDKNNLIGYYCFGEAAQVPTGRKFGVYDDKGKTDIGLGMNPNLCGKGFGYEFLKNGMEFANNELSVKGFRLTVATFNQRAIIVYRRLGFREVASFKRVMENNSIEFIVMIR